MDNKNETSYNNLGKRRKLKKRDNQKNNNSKKNIFLSKTFASKLFLKLTSKIIDPIIVCLQTLKFEPENRKKEEIENTIPYLKTLQNFKNFVNFREKEESSFNLMVKFAKITYYQYYRKNTILKRAGTNNDKFYIILNGTIDKYKLIFEKRYLTIEQYLCYLIKLDIIGEKEIIKKCNTLNKATFNKMGISGGQSILTYFNIFMKKKYNETYLKAKTEIIDENLNDDLFNGRILKRISSIDKYLKIIDCNTLKKVINDGEPKFGLWIGKYRLASFLTKGNFFNNITDEVIKDNNLYICKTNCDIGQITRENFIEENLNLSVKLKMENLFKEIKNEFYFFRGINDEKFINDYSHLMLYKKYKKGDEIIIQGGIYEGVYLIYNGEITVSTKTNIDKLGKLIINIIYSMKSFPEHIPAFNTKKLIEEFNNKHKLLYTSGDFPLTEFLKEKYIEISTVKKNDILGLCDLYDYKTEICNFTAKCVSDEAELIFITKNNFNLLLAREMPLLDAIISMVEYKIQFVVGKLRSFSEQTLKLLTGKRKNIKDIKNNSTSNIYSFDNKINLNSSKFNISIENPSNSSRYKTNNSYVHNQNLSSSNMNRNSPLIFNNISKEIMKKAKMNNLNRINHSNLYNWNSRIKESSSYMPLLYKTINAEMFYSKPPESDYMRYNSNNGNLKKKFISNDSVYNNNFSHNANSTHSKIFTNNKLSINFDRNNEIRRKIDICFPSFSFNKKEVQNEKQKNYKKTKLFPTLNNKYSNNLEFTKLIYK